MALGKKTGGRKPGSRNKALVAREREIIASGELPLDYMLRVQRDPLVDHDRRDKMAIAAAPFVHPKLQSSENKHTHGVSDPLLALLERIATNGTRIHDKPRSVP
jgi:hypothetical protein